MKARFHTCHAGSLPGSTIIGNEIFGPVQYAPDRNLDFRPGSLIGFKYMVFIWFGVGNCCIQVWVFFFNVITLGYDKALKKLVSWKRARRQWLSMGNIPGMSWEAATWTNASWFDIYWFVIWCHPKEKRNVTGSFCDSFFSSTTICEGMNSFDRAKRTREIAARMEALGAEMIGTWSLCQGLLQKSMERSMYRQLELLERMGKAVRDGLCLQEDDPVQLPSRFRAPKEKRGDDISSDDEVAAPLE